MSNYPKKKRLAFRTQNVTFLSDINLLKEPLVGEGRGGGCPYDALYVRSSWSDQPYTSVPKTSKFRSGPRVKNMVLNTQHATLSISMASNVISYKKIKKIPNLRNDQKSPKSSVTETGFTQSFVKVWQILDGTSWILMSRRFGIWVLKGGRGCFWPSYGRLKLTHIKITRKSTHRCASLAGLTGLTGLTGPQCARWENVVILVQRPFFK